MYETVRGATGMNTMLHQNPAPVALYVAKSNDTISRMIIRTGRIHWTILRMNTSAPGNLFLQLFSYSERAGCGIPVQGVV